MWMNQVQNSPFLYDMLAQQRFKVTHVDLGTARDSRDVHISSRNFVKADKTSNVQLPFLSASSKSASLILLNKAL